MPDVFVTDIEESGGMDRIEVYWRDYAPCKGSVTITCHGCAWTAWFGGMGDRTIKEFVADAGVDYLVTKLGINPTLKQLKKDNEHLAKIIRCIKKAIA